MSDERTPLLQFFGEASGSRSDPLGDHHTQFCRLIGTRPLDLPEDQKHVPQPESLYHRAMSHHTQQHITYVFTAALTNTLIMAQIVLGAALTGLGASNASGVLVTIFGALNTVIAGGIAFLKSRGQPMRARMFRDDLGRVIDEIDNSSIMWLGISKGAHGYDAIDTDDQVTVRSEVARLTRLYDKAVKTNTLNDPDNYAMGGPSDPHAAALRDKSSLPVAPVPAPPAPAASSSDPAPAPAPAPAAAQDPDASPATTAPEPPKPTEAEPPAGDTPKPADASPSSDKGKEVADPSAQTSGQAATSQPSSSDPPTTTTQPATPAPAPAPTPATPVAPAAPTAPADPDESPASAAHPEKHSQDTSKT